MGDLTHRFFVNIFQGYIYIYKNKKFFPPPLHFKSLEKNSQKNKGLILSDLKTFKVL